MNNLTLEHFENGITIYQDQNLYKFTADAIKLAKFCKIKRTDNVLDMCAGCGVVGFYAYSLNECNKLYFNDIQKPMCNLIRKNIKLNNLENKCEVIQKDLKDLTLADFEKHLDVILCNPPYFKVNGKIKENISVAMCRHELTTNLEEVICKASKLISSKGKLYIIIPADRFCECVILFNKYGFEAKRVEISYFKDVATVSILEGVKNAKSGVKINIKKEGL